MLELDHININDNLTSVKDSQPILFDLLVNQ